MSKDSELIDFIRSFREPVRLSEAATELHHLGKLGADWPRASFEHWTRELEQLANEGKLDIDIEGLVSVPRGEAVQQQMELF